MIEAASLAEVAGRQTRATAAVETPMIEMRDKVGDMGHEARQLATTAELERARELLTAMDMLRWLGSWEGTGE